MRQRGQRKNRQAGDGTGAPPPLKASAIRTVRFQEVDLMGVVWHGRYPEYFEDGRCAVGEAYGLDYPDFYREGIQAPIVKFEIEYGHPLLPGDVFRVETSLLWSEAVRLDHVYEIIRQSDERVMARGSTVQLFLDTDNKLLMVWPEYFQQLRERWKSGELIKKDG
jgi:acyl-CoA thioester hydrolase